MADRRRRKPAERPAEAAERRKDILIGRNPVIEALKSGREIEKLLLVKGAEGSAAKIVAPSPRPGGATCGEGR